jgi:hypothetical protein
MDILAEIKSLRYSPLLCDKLEEIPFADLESVLSRRRRPGSFILSMDAFNKFAVSWWVSPKRTRSYPYARVYDTLGFSGKKVTIIPVFKDEGKRGDRDYLEWDAISLMSLLGVNVVVSYYRDAIGSTRYPNKITDQKFDFAQVETELRQLLCFQSDALHWNYDQIGKVGDIAQKALDSYERISGATGVEMHSRRAAQQRIDEILRQRGKWTISSRDLAQKAQTRESVTTQPKERLSGDKARLTIRNYMGGEYYLTVDEARIEGDTVVLTEAKHSERASLPSRADIKDGLLKMVIFGNLENVTIKEKSFKSIAVLKLTSSVRFPTAGLNTKQEELLELLKRESAGNRFRVTY